MKNYAQEAKRLKEIVEYNELEGPPKNFKDIMAYQKNFLEKLMQEKVELNSTIQILKDQIFEIQAEMFLISKLKTSKLFKLDYERIGREEESNKNRRKKES